MHWFHTAARAVRGQLKGGALAAHRAWSGPGRERDLLVQAVKAALAAFLAWLAAGWWLQAPVAFVAPWVAIVLVESTVYRSIAHGLQQLAAIATGTVVATAVALALNSTLPAMAVVLPATVLLGNWRRLGSQGIYAATGALFVLTGPSVGFATSAARIGEAVFGALVGIAVNALIRPPTYLRSPRAALHDAAEEARSVMEDVADGLDGADWDAARAGEWHERALHLSRLVDQARSALGWSRESLRVNPRRRARAVAEPGSAYDDAVTVFDYVAVHTAGVTRTVLETAGEDRTLSWPGAPWPAPTPPSCARPPRPCASTARPASATAPPRSSGRPSKGCGTPSANCAAGSRTPPPGTPRISRPTAPCSPRPAASPTSSPPLTRAGDRNFAFRWDSLEL